MAVVNRHGDRDVLTKRIHILKLIAGKIEYRVFVDRFVTGAGCFSRIVVVVRRPEIHGNGRRIVGLVYRRSVFVFGTAIGATRKIAASITRPIIDGDVQRNGIVVILIGQLDLKIGQRSLYIGKRTLNNQRTIAVVTIDLVQPTGAAERNPAAGRKVKRRAVAVCQRNGGLDKIGFAGCCIYVAIIHICIGDGQGITEIVGKGPEKVDDSVAVVIDLRGIVSGGVDINIKCRFPASSTFAVDMAVNRITDLEFELVSRRFRAVLLITQRTVVDVCLGKRRTDAKTTAIQCQEPVFWRLCQPVLKYFRVRIVRVDRPQQRVIDDTGTTFCDAERIVGRGLFITVLIGNRSISTGLILRKNGRIVLRRNRNIQCLDTADITDRRRALTTLAQRAKSTGRRQIVPDFNTETVGEIFGAIVGIPKATSAPVRGCCQQVCRQQIVRCDANPVTAIEALQQTVCWQVRDPEHQIIRNGFFVRIIHVPVFARLVVHINVVQGDLGVRNPGCTALRKQWQVIRVDHGRVVGWNGFQGESPIEGVVGARRYAKSEAVLVVLRTIMEKAELAVVDILLGKGVKQPKIGTIQLQGSVARQLCQPVNRFLRRNCN